MFGFDSLEDIVIKIDADIKNAVVGLQTVGRTMGKMKTQVEASSAKIRTATAAMTKAFVTLGAVTGVALVALGGVMTAQSAGMESYIVTLEQLYGSMDVAAEKLRWLLEFAKTTPFELPGLIEATTKLKAYGIDAENVLRGLGDTAAAMGKPINMAVEALADAQTGEFERLKEFGIKAIQITESNAATLGVAMTAIGQTVLTSTDRFGKKRVDIIDRNNREIITSTLMSIWNAKYAGGMAKQAATLKGMVSNIKGSMYEGSLAIMGFDATVGAFRPDSIFIKVKSAADSLLDYINQIDFEQVAANVEDVIDKILGYFTKLYEDLAPTWNNLTVMLNSIKSIAKSVTETFGDTGDIMETLTGIINKVTFALATVFQWLQDHPTVTKMAVTIGTLAVALAYLPPILAGIAAAITFITGPVGIAIAAIILLAAAWDENLFGIQDKTKIVVDWLKKTFVDIINFLGPLVETYLNTWIDVYNALVPILQAAGIDIERTQRLTFTRMEYATDQARDSTETAFEDMAGAATTGTETVISALDDQIAAFEAAGGAAGNTADTVSAALDKMKGGLTISLLEKGITREDLAQREADIASGRLTMVGQPTTTDVNMDLPEIATNTWSTTDAIKNTTREQEETNEKLDMLKQLGILPEISMKLDELQMVTINNITNNNRGPTSRSSSSGTTPAPSGPVDDDEWVNPITTKLIRDYHPAPILLG